VFILDSAFQAELGEALVTTLWMVAGIAVIFGVYLAFSAAAWGINWLMTKGRQQTGYTSLKTVTFGDESAVEANRFASFASIIALFLLWAIATGSNLLPFQLLPGPFTGLSQLEYVSTGPDGSMDSGTIRFLVESDDVDIEVPVEPEVSEGFAKDDATSVKARRSKIINPLRNDDGTKADGFRVTQVDGQDIQPGETVPIDAGEVFMTNSGSLSLRPYEGLTMEALFLPPPEQVWDRFINLNLEGYQNVGLWENVFWSLARVIIGFFLGCLFGIPLGFAMGLTNWFRGWFDPIVEFMRPVPPLALIPLIIIWFGIGEQGKISLLFLAALWIMAIAARAGVSGVSISKVHAAYSLGATKSQVLTKVILPNSLPEIFTGARVAMGVCWGTVVAAELVAAEKGAGKMIIAASKFQLTDIVIIGIIIIGVIGYGIDVLMRIAEKQLVPWKGRA